MDIVDLIGCLSIGVRENLWEPNFPVKKWEKFLLRWLIVKRSLATPIAYVQRNAYLKYHVNPSNLRFEKHGCVPSGETPGRADHS